MTGRRWAALAGLAVVLLGTIAGLSRVDTNTTAASLLPAGDPAARVLREVDRSFGGDPVVVIAESARPRQLLTGDELGKLMALEGRLAKLPDTAAVYGPATVLNQLAGTAQNLLAALSGKRDALRTAAEDAVRRRGGPAAAIERAGDQAVAEFDLRYGSLLVRGLPAGLPTLRNPAFVNAVVFDPAGEPRQQWRFVVPSPTAIAILVRPREDLDQAGNDRLVATTRAAAEHAGLKTGRLTVTGVPAVATGLGDQLRREIPLLGLLAVGLIGGCYLIVRWVPRRGHRLLPLAATLGATALTLAAFGWLGHPLSLGVVAFLPILVGTGSDFPAYLVRGAGRRPVLAAALAAAAGFASLALSPMPFVRDLGLALAAGVLVAVGLGLLFSRRVAPLADVTGTVPPSPSPALSPLRRAGLLVVAAGVAGAGWAGVAQLPVEARPERLAAGLPALDAAEHAESVLGASGEVRIVVRGTDVLTPDALTWMRGAEDTAVRRFGDRLHPVVSLPGLLAFLGPEPTREQITAGLAQLPRYLAGAVVRDDGRQAVIGLGLELADLGDQRELLDELRTSLPPLPDGLSADVTGIPVVAARGYELVSGDRYLASLTGILAAGLVLLLGLRRAVALRAVLAALLATGWGLAGAWLLGISLTPLTVALGSLATATACEFTVVLGHARRSLMLRRSVAAAAAAATVGYLALAASGLPVIREFGAFLAVTVVLSLVAAHVVIRLFPTRPERVPEVAPAPAAVPTEVAV